MSFSACLWAIAAGALLLSARVDRARTRQALRVSWTAFARIAPIMLGIVGLIGLILAILPPAFITDLFADRNVWSLIAVASVGAITIIPGFIAYPLAAALMRQGAGLVPVAAFITSLMMVGVVTAPLEGQLFGRRFAFVRNALSFAAAFAVALGIGMILH